jgi:putative flippase GtrA
MSGFLATSFVRFLAVGVLNTAFGYALFALLVWAGVWYPAAASTIGGMIFNFNTTGRLVFGRPA